MIIQQIIRPTGLLDHYLCAPNKSQIDDILKINKQFQNKNEF